MRLGPKGSFHPQRSQHYGKTLLLPQKQKPALLSVANKIFLLIASGLGSGYLRPAPGTWGSAAACLWLWVLGWFWQPGLLAYWGVAITLFLLGAKCAQYAGRVWRQVDDGRIVIDEWLGIWLSMLALPWDASALILAFVFFRIFDIYKPFPASYIDRRWKNAWGVMLDDVVAGVYANISVHLSLLGLDMLIMPAIHT